MLLVYRCVVGAVDQCQVSYEIPQLDQRGSQAMATALGDTVGRQIEVLGKGQNTS